VWWDFRREEDPEAPTTVERPFPSQASDPTPAPGSSGIPDRGSVRESSPVSASSAPGGGRAPKTGVGALHELLGTSNALVVSGRESRSGRPLAVFGPQTGYFSPQILMDSTCTRPGVRRGRARTPAARRSPESTVRTARARPCYAWSATSAGQDIVDTFALELCGPGGVQARSYRYRGRCHRIETLRRDNQSPSTLACQCPPGRETLTTGRTKLGLVVGRGRIGGKPMLYVSLRSTYFHEADSAVGFVDYHNAPERMRSASDFQRAASRSASRSTGFANRRSIAYFNSGNNPVRRRGSTTTSRCGRA
jgi:acyl-homoserine lactone acylase PvdQ